MIDRALLVANPFAGTVTRSVVAELAARCRRRVAQVNVRWVRNRGDAARFAAQAARSGGPSTVVLAVGGDGTAMEVVQGLASAWRGRGRGTVPMLIVPCGTANSYYRTMWGDLPWQDTLDAALADPARTLRHLDLARWTEHGQLVLAGAATGFAAEAIHCARAITDLSGRARYEKALADLAGRFEPYPGRVVVDDVEIHNGPTMLANVGGSRYRGGQYEVLPHTIVDDGLLDVCIIGGEHDPTEMLRLARSGTHVARSGVVYARGRRVIIERTDGEPVWFEHDGEVGNDLGATFTFDVVPQGVPMLVGDVADRGRRAA